IGDRIRVILDLEENTLAFEINNKFLGVAFRGLPKKRLFPAFYGRRGLEASQKHGVDAIPAVSMVYLGSHFNALCSTSESSSSGSRSSSNSGSSSNSDSDDLQSEDQGATATTKAPVQQLTSKGVAFRNKRTPTGLPAASNRPMATKTRNLGHATSIVTCTATKPKRTRELDSTPDEFLEKRPREEELSQEPVTQAPESIQRVADLRRSLLGGRRTTDGSGSAGVGFLLNIQAQKALIEWEPVSSRLAKARFRSKLFNVTVFAVYAPTRVSSEQAIDTFYAELNEAVKKTPKRDLLIIGGDLNAHVGSRQANGDRSLGIHGYGERCERGTRLVQFAQANNLVIANTLFRHKPSHVITWRSRDGRTSSQLDYLLVSSRWRSSIQNCRAYRGPDTGSKCGSDHTLVKMSVKIRLVARKRKEPPKRFDVARLKDPTVVEQFRVQLSNRFTALEHEHSNESPEDGNSSGSSVNEDWQKFRNTLQEVALETLGRVKRKRRRWMSEETIRLATKK
ncbi:hypothetical protein QYM36_016061, partial [Artemia franciscana]